MKRTSDEAHGDNIGLMIRYTFRAFTLVLQSAAADHAITATEFRVLRTLGEGGKLTQIELANLIAVERPYVASLIKSLTNKGLISTARSEVDGRRIDLDLTQDGKKVLRAIAKQLAQANARAVNGVSTRDLETFKDVLLRMRGNLEAE